jgi:hypothetical protein
MVVVVMMVIVVIVVVGVVHRELHGGGIHDTCC